MTIGALIDKQDNVEIIQAKIGEILLTEVASQKALAIAAGEDPLLWNLRVFTNRTNPWSEYLKGPNQETVDATPIVNIFFDNASVDGRASNVVQTQVYTGSFNVDCYGYGVSAYDVAGHIAGDKKAKDESLRATRLVRNILMAADYTYLGLQPTVTQRMARSIEAFRPPQDERGATHVQAHRIDLAVRYDEQAPQAIGQPLEEVSVEVKRKETGEIYLTALYDTI